MACPQPDWVNTPRIKLFGNFHQLCSFPQPKEYFSNETWILFKVLDYENVEMLSNLPHSNKIATKQNQCIILHMWHMFWWNRSWCCLGITSSAKLFNKSICVGNRYKWSRMRIQSMFCYVHTGKGGLNRRLNSSIFWQVGLTVRGVTRSRAPCAHYLSPLLAKSNWPIGLWCFEVSEG